MAMRRQFLAGQRIAMDDETGELYVKLSNADIDIGDIHLLNVAKAKINPATEDKQTAVILLDVVLGYGSHPDPAGALAPAVRRATDRDVAVVASLTGTPADPQGYHRQKRALNEMGVVVMPSNAQAARFAALVCARGKLDVGGGGGER